MTWGRTSSCHGDDTELQQPVSLRRGFLSNGRRILPTPVAWIGDMMEQFYLQGLRGSLQWFPVPLLTPKDQLDRLDAPHVHGIQTKAEYARLGRPISSLLLEHIHGNPHLWCC